MHWMLCTYISREAGCCHLPLEPVTFSAASKERTLDHAPPRRQGPSVALIPSPALSWSVLTPGPLVGRPHVPRFPSTGRMLNSLPVILASEQLFSAWFLNPAMHSRGVSKSLERKSGGHRVPFSEVPFPWDHSSCVRVSRRCIE